MSPIIFAMFLNSLNDSICLNTKGVQLGRNVFHTLMYADDLILLSETAEDIQSQLDKLNVFTTKVQVEVNVNKTKIMLFKKNKRQSKAKKKWYLGDNAISECYSYKYLGVTFKSNGSYNEHIGMVKQKAGKAYFALISKCKELNGLQSGLFLYLFDQMIPIINYGSKSGDLMRGLPLKV